MLALLSPDRVVYAGDGTYRDNPHSVSRSSAKSIVERHLNCKANNLSSYLGVRREHVA